MADVAGSHGPLIVAFSGGADSVAALNWALLEARDRKPLAIIVDHGIQSGSECRAEDAALLAEQAGAEVVIRSLRLGKVGQSRARQARLTAFAEAAIAAGASQIVTGHHSDDLAETVLMRLARPDCGLTGMAGFASSDPFPLWPQGLGLSLTRPLLAKTRRGIREDLAREGRVWIDDPANILPDYERVRARSVVQSGEVRQRLLQVAGRAARINRRHDALAFDFLQQSEHDISEARLCLDADKLRALTDDAFARALRAVAMMVSGRLSALSQFARRDFLDRLETSRSFTLGHALWSIRKTRIHVCADPRWREGDRAGEPVMTRAGPVLGGRWLLAGDDRQWLGPEIARRLLAFTEHKPHV